MNWHTVRGSIPITRSKNQINHVSNRGSFRRWRPTLWKRPHCLNNQKQRLQITITVDYIALIKATVRNRMKRLREHYFYSANLAEFTRRSYESCKKDGIIIFAWEESE